MSNDLLLPTRRRLPAAEAIAAADVAILADGLLACLGAPFLTIQRSADRLLPVLVWDDRLAPCRRRTATLYTSPPLSLPLTALHAAAASAPSSGRCTPDCIVTDGTGVALIEGHPHPDLGWLIDAAQGQGSIVVQPFAADSVWTMLRADA